MASLIYVHVVHIRFISSYMNIKDIYVCKVHVEQYKLCLYFMFMVSSLLHEDQKYAALYKFSPLLLYIWS